MYFLLYFAWHLRVSLVLLSAVAYHVLLLFSTQLLTRCSLLPPCTSPFTHGLLLGNPMICSLSMKQQSFSVSHQWDFAVSKLSSGLLPQWDVNVRFYEAVSWVFAKYHIGLENFRYVCLLSNPCMELWYSLFMLVSISWKYLYLLLYHPSLFISFPSLSSLSRGVDLSMEGFMFESRNMVTLQTGKLT